MAGIWDKVTEVSSPSWTSISEITTPSWSTVTVLNSITYKESSGTTPSIDLVNAWNLVDDEWEQFLREYDAYVCYK